MSVDLPGFPPPPEDESDDAEIPDGAVGLPAARKANPHAVQIIRKRQIRKARDGDAGPVRRAIARSRSTEKEEGRAFDLATAAVDLADGTDDGDNRVLTLRGCPKWVKVVYSDAQVAALSRGDCIPTGPGWAAALRQGLAELLDEGDVEFWAASIAVAKDDASDLPLTSRVRIHHLIESPECSVGDPVGSGREGLSFRCPNEVSKSLYEALKYVYLPQKVSTVGLPCICKGLARQPGVGDEASGYLEAAYEDLVRVFAEAADDLEKITRGFRDED